MAGGGLPWIGAHNLYIADSATAWFASWLANGTITTVAGNGAPVNQETEAGHNAPDSQPVRVIAVSAAGQTLFLGTTTPLPSLAAREPLLQLSLTRPPCRLRGGRYRGRSRFRPAPHAGGRLRASFLDQRQGPGERFCRSESGRSGNPGALRTATLSIAGTAVAVTQADGVCSYSLGASGGTTLPGGGTGSIAVTADASCPWTASSPADWVTLTGSTSGVGVAR